MKIGISFLDQSRIWIFITNIYFAWYVSLKRNYRSNSFFSQFPIKIRVRYGFYKIVSQLIIKKKNSIRNPYISYLFPLYQ